jgi:hypothetical protein
MIVDMKTKIGCLAAKKLSVLDVAYAWKRAAGRMIVGEKNPVRVDIERAREKPAGRNEHMRFVTFGENLFGNNVSGSISIDSNHSFFAQILHRQSEVREQRFSILSQFGSDKFFSHSVTNELTHHKNDVDPMLPGVGRLSQFSFAGLCEAPYGAEAMKQARGEHRRIAMKRRKKRRQVTMTLALASRACKSVPTPVMSTAIHTGQRSIMSNANNGIGISTKRRMWAITAMSWTDPTHKVHHRSYLSAAKTTATSAAPSSAALKP